MTVRAKTVTAVMGGAFALVALTAGAAQAGHHQAHSAPVTEDTVAGGPYKPVTEDPVAGYEGPYKPPGAVLNNPSPLG